MSINTTMYSISLTTHDLDVVGSSLLMFQSLFSLLSHPYFAYALFIVFLVTCKSSPKSLLDWLIVFSIVCSMLFLIHQFYSWIYFLYPSLMGFLGLEAFSLDDVAVCMADQPINNAVDSGEIDPSGGSSTGNNPNITIVHQHHNYFSDNATFWTIIAASAGIASKIPGSIHGKVLTGLGTMTTLAGLWVTIKSVSDPVLRADLTRTYNSIVDRASIADKYNVKGAFGGPGGRGPGGMGPGSGSGGGSGISTLSDTSNNSIDLGTSTHPTSFLPINNEGITDSLYVLCTKYNLFTIAVVLLSISILLLLTLALWSLFVRSRKDNIVLFIKTSRFSFMSPFLTYYFVVNKVIIFYCIIVVYVNLIALIFLGVHFIFTPLPELPVI
jgi:hypothetical protein